MALVFGGKNFFFLSADPKKDAWRPFEGRLLRGRPDKHPVEGCGWVKPSRRGAQKRPPRPATARRL